jgi:alcohol dehydrogenase (cytochrome c)
MYVTAPNECFALDAGTGRQIWHYQRPRTPGLTQGSANRGVSVAGDRVFMETDHAHVIALNRFTGDLLWETSLADWQQNYAASSAPLPAVWRDARSTKAFCTQSRASSSAGRFPATN